MTGAGRWGEELKRRAGDLGSFAAISVVTVSAFLVIDQNRIHAMQRAEEQRRLLSVEMLELKAACLKVGR